MEDELAVFFIFGGGATFLLAMSPVGRAIADRIRGRGSLRGDEGVRLLQENQDAMAEEIDTLRHDVGDLQERVDFAERLLAKKRHEDLPPGSPDVQP